MIMNINSKYSNEEILKSITNENLKRWAEFLDSRGAILLQVKETEGLYTSKQIKILSTKHNIITIDFDGGLYYKSKFVKIYIDDFTDRIQNQVYIYLNEENIELIINEKFDGINLGKYFEKIDITYDNYVKVSNIMIEKYSDNYNLLDIETKGYKLIVTLYKIQSNINYKEREYLYLIFDKDYNFTESTEKPKYDGSIKFTNINSGTGILNNNYITTKYTEREEK